MYEEVNLTNVQDAFKINTIVEKLIKYFVRKLTFFGNNSYCIG